ncbi:MAG: cell division protein FtsZ [Paludibacter sp.]|jgi:cell division protein FtsZ|nr:cell division protein FtsZ [Paludibacter sp.]
MDTYGQDLPLDLPTTTSSIIKVVGVGGGGQNAVNHMFRQGIKDVTFVVCNTDIQVLRTSPVPVKLQLGKDLTQGLGAGGKPEIGRQAAEESLEEFKKILDDNTKMVFITTGMGGGTGTGAAPLLAKEAYEKGLLTIGIVTIPFEHEGKRRISNALQGVLELSKYVDALLVINNQKLCNIYPDLDIQEGFAKADDVLATSAKGIAEIITVEGYVNVDFADVRNIMKDGKLALMNTGSASGEHRITKAIENALESPLLNTNKVNGASKVLFAMYCSSQNKVKMSEIDEIHEFMKKVGNDIEVAWGVFFDDTLTEEVKVTLIATGYEVSEIPGMPKNVAVNIQNNNEQNISVPENQMKSDVFSRILDDILPETKEEPQEDTLENQAKKIENVYYNQTYLKTKISPKEDETDANANADIPFEITNNTSDEAKPDDSVTYGRVAELDELNDEEDLKQIEKVPAWKRKFGFKN